MASKPVANSAVLKVPVLPNRNLVSLKDPLDKTVRQMRALGTSYEEAVRAFRQHFIMNVLMAHSCHLGRAAQQLGIHRNTMTRTIRELNIEVRQIRNIVQLQRGRRSAPSCAQQAPQTLHN
jgi:Fis family transcriptional regulator